MITLSKELNTLINMRGGNEYILHCLEEIILHHETPNYYELEQAAGWDVYERLALHKESNAWAYKLFPKLRKKKDEER